MVEGSTLEAWMVYRYSSPVVVVSVAPLKNAGDRVPETEPLTLSLRFPVTVPPLVFSA